MSDHWNSLADQLGTPSLVPHQRKPSAKPKEPTKSPVESHSTPSVESNVVDSAEAVSPPQVKSETPSRLRSSWDSVARLFGVGSGPEPSQALEALVTGTNSVAPAASNEADDLFEGFGKKKDRKPSSMWGETTPVEAPTAPVAKEAPKPTSPAIKADPAPKKNKSFWDTVEDAVDPEPEVVAHESPKSNLPPSRSRHAESTRPQSPRQDGRRPARSESRDASRSDNRNERSKPLDGLDESDSSASNPLASEDTSGDQPERRGRRRNIRRGRGNEAGDQPVREEVAFDQDLPVDSDDSEIRPAARRPEREPRPPRESRPPRGDRNREGRSSEPRSSDARSSEPRNAEPRSSESRNDLRSNDSRPPRTARPTESGPAGRDRDDNRSERPRPSRNRNERSDASAGDSRERAPRVDRSDRSDSNAPRTPARPAAKRGWDDLEPVEEVFVEVDVDDENDFVSSEDSEAPTSDEPRKRRRRRRGGAGRRPVAEESSSDDSSPATSSGRQVYGRHADDDDLVDDVESLDRGFQVTAWADAIASIIDRNMENHKRPSSNDYRGRSGNRNNGSSRRRN
ncbi:MAG: hypothetical protein NTW52_03700 [Planctomycetota bacterium]|nr:hypothetical protein [Planctomycetota bacterium]